MTHIVHPPGVDAENRLDPNCHECQSKPVGSLDNAHFAQLMGMERHQFEDYCQELASRVNGNPYGQAPPSNPTGLYNFWYAIMDANALSVQIRKDELAWREREQ